MDPADVKVTDLTLLEQNRITELELDERKRLLSFSIADEHALAECREPVSSQLDRVVSRFYEIQTGTPEIALLIGDADTLTRLRAAQRRYVEDLFSGCYDLEYVNHRLRIGLVHKRIGVEPRLYLSAVHLLKGLLLEAIDGTGLPDETRSRAGTALDKLLYLDVALVFETYISSMLSEIVAAHDRIEQYAMTLEGTVRERTRQLEELARVDALTGLLNRRYLHDTLTQALRAAERRSEPLSIAFLDLDDFKSLNDEHGHKHGDQVLARIGVVLRNLSRGADSCFRYGGDEFCVILPDCRAEEASSLYARRLQHRLDETLPGIRLSVGVAATGPLEFCSPADLLAQADAAMYAAKFEVARQAHDGARRGEGRRAAPSDDHPGAG